MQSAKRNYIRKKKYLKEAADQIRSTLEFISYAQKEDINSEKLQLISQHHAEAIEAACWSPHIHLTSEEYQTLMNTKTQELCRALILKAFPNIDIKLLQRYVLQNPKPENQNAKNLISESNILPHSSSQILSSSFCPLSQSAPRSLTPNSSFPLPMVPSSAPTRPPLPQVTPEDFTTVNTLSEIHGSFNFDNSNDDNLFNFQTDMLESFTSSFSEDSSQNAWN